VAPAARAARFWITTSSGRTVTHGTVIIRHGGLVLHTVRGFHRGHYKLIIKTWRGRILVRRPFVVG
jgi:hypothetical protein